MSADEDWLLLRCHRAVDDGTLKERPTTGRRSAIRLRVTLPWTGEEGETWPDQWYGLRARTAVYIDGPHHKKGVHPKRDTFIRNRLRKMGINVIECDMTELTKTQALKKIITGVNDAIDKLYEIPEAWTNPGQRQ
jgi:hypothetical protein